MTGSIPSPFYFGSDSSNSFDFDYTDFQKHGCVNIEPVFAKGKSSLLDQGIRVADDKAEERQRKKFRLG